MCYSLPGLTAYSPCCWTTVTCSCSRSTGRHVCKLAKGPLIKQGIGRFLYLVADVPRDFVLWGIEHIVQGHSQLNDSQRGAQMPCNAVSLSLVTSSVPILAEVFSAEVY